LEEIQENVGPDLVHGSGIVGGPGGSGEPVDTSHRSPGAVGGKVEAVEVGGSVGVGCARYPTFFDRFLITGLGGVGVDEDHKFSDPGSQLTSRLVGSALQCDFGNPLGVVLVEMSGFLDDDPGFGEVDPTFA
jgi:hypothetical protein